MLCCALGSWPRRTSTPCWTPLSVATFRPWPCWPLGTCCPVRLPWGRTRQQSFVGAALPGAAARLMQWRWRCDAVVPASMGMCGGGRVRPLLGGPAHGPPGLASAIPSAPGRGGSVAGLGCQAPRLRRAAPAGRGCQPAVGRGGCRCRHGGGSAGGVGTQCGPAGGRLAVDRHMCISAVLSLG